MFKILLIDDDEIFSFALSTLLRAGGHEPTIAHTVVDALAAVRSTCFDVALLDMLLPDASGLELLNLLEGVDPLLPIIFITGVEDTATIVSAMRQGAVDYLSKPVDRKTLFNAVTMAGEYSRARRGGEAPKGVAVPVGASAAWRKVVDLLTAVAQAPRTTVLLTGEPGVGKEVAANLLHRMSKRNNGPMVSANAACFTQSLMESELFGHEVGAFTGANKRRRGLFEQADGGFLFLDEIGELPLDLQGRLLRVLEGHPFRRVGGEESIQSNARLVCATNRDLPALVAKGQFRADLFDRLRVFEVRLPPLRERRDDILHLVHHFIAKLGQELVLPVAGISNEAIEALKRHDWPGNVRELRNVIERALVLSSGNPITPRHLPHELSHPESSSAAPAAASGGAVRLEEVIQKHIVGAFERSGRNVTHTAQLLGISRLALRRRLQSYGILTRRS